jgi:hypothetical protein
MERRQPVTPGLINIKVDVVAAAVGRPETVNAPRLVQLPIHNVLQQLLGVLIQVLCLFTYRGIIEDRRETAS